MTKLYQSMRRKEIAKLMDKVIPLVQEEMSDLRTERAIMKAKVEKLEKEMMDLSAVIADAKGLNNGIDI